MTIRISAGLMAAAFLLSATFSTPAAAETVDDVVALLDSLNAVEAPVFAPKTFEKATREYNEAKRSIEIGRKQNTIDKYVEKALEFSESALKATEVAKLTLADYLTPRNRARYADAHDLVPKEYNEAEQQFMKATQKVESGDVKNGLKEAQKSAALFDQAELEAIRIDVIGTADRLIAEAEGDDAEKFALATLDKARTARHQADSILTWDRYNRDEAIRSARLAQYEARHASNIAQTVRSLKRNDQAWEKLMLVYEIELNRIGRSLGRDYLPLDAGPQAAADTAIGRIKSLSIERDQLTADKEQLATSLAGTLERMGTPATDKDALLLAEAVGEQVTVLKQQADELSSRLQSKDEQLSELEQTHEEVSAKLEVRQAREAKLRTAKAIINPTEGEVLFNASNDVVLRLTGLSFDVGKSDIKDEHAPLLEKVGEVIDLFPNAQLVVEGHTDAAGNETTNRQLSEKRAYAVMQYLRQAREIPATEIRAIGFGAEKPVASNKTAEGRAKNRRIDIVIMQ